MKVLKPYDDLLDSYPLLRLLLPLVLGIGLGEWFADWLLDWEIEFFVVAVLFLAATIFIFKQRGSHASKYLPFYFSLTLGIISLGIALQISSLKSLRVIWPQHKSTFRALVVDCPRDGEKVVQTTVKLLGGELDGKLVRVGLMKEGRIGKDSIAAVDHNVPVTRFRDSATIAVGDVLLLRARIKIPQNAGNPSEFDFAAWLRHHGVAGSTFCFPSDWKRSEVGVEQLPFRIRALQWREHLINLYHEYFEGREFGILSAMTLGDKTHLDAEVRDVFSNSGVSHVLALSGLHLSILFAIFRFSVLSLCRRRWLYFTMSLVGIAGLWIFAFLAGMPTSLVRASVMFTIMQLMDCLRKDSQSINNLAFAALFLLLCSPQSLFDVGFQLSCLSVFSIILFANSITCPKWLRRFRLSQMMFNLLAVSFCAQMATAPLVAYYFHTFPLIGFVANLVAVPLAYLILPIAAGFFLLPFAQPCLALVLGFLLKVMESSLTYLSDLPHAVLELYPSAFTVLLVYVVLFFVVRYWIHHKAVYLYILSALLLLIFGIEVDHRRSKRLSSQIVFYNLGNVAAVHVLSSNTQSYIWSNHFSKMDSSLASVKRTFWKEENMTAPILLTSEIKNKMIYFSGSVLVFDGRRIAFCARRLSESFAVVPLKVDYLLLARGASNDFPDILRYYRPEVVILDASLTDYYYEKYKEETRKVGMNVYDMREEGALRFYLQKE